MRQQAAVKQLLKSLFLLVNLLTIGSGLLADLVKKQGSFFQAMFSLKVHPIPQTFLVRGG
jgi:hypothetical protein